MQGNRIWRSKRSVQFPPRRRMPTFVGGGGGRLGWGRGGSAWRHRAAERTTPTPTLPQLGGGRRGACFVICDCPAPTWGRLGRGKPRFGARQSSLASPTSILPHVGA